MRERQRIRIPLANRFTPGSLCWDGDELVDWVGGGARYRLDGSMVYAKVSYGYRFDRGYNSRDGAIQMLVESLGTKGLVLSRGKVVREINRSFYHADAYEYPIGLCEHDGRCMLVHCPDEYNHLEIEDALSGERLTQRKSKSPDFFHSRIQVSQDGRHLLSAGWVWHPLDALVIHDLRAVFREPECLSGHGLEWGRNLPETGEAHVVHAATFVGSGHVVLAMSDADDGDNRLRMLDLASPGIIADHAMSGPAGTLLLFGDHVIACYGHLRLLDPATGHTVLDWPEFASGCQNSSIIHHHAQPPPVAADGERHRFALVEGDAIVVVQLDV